MQQNENERIEKPEEYLDTKILKGRVTTIKKQTH